jgi:porin
LPGDALLGLVAAGYLTDNIYAIAGFGDSNSDPTDPFNGFDTFFDQSEFFKTIELGWTTSKDRFYFDNVHLTYWHNDERVEAMVPKGWGLNFSATTYLNDKWLPFLRGGYTEDGGSLLQKSVSAGFGYQPVPQRDLIGFAANWGQPNETTYATGLPDQVTFELFYRFQLSTRLALTPDIQYLIDPAVNPESSSIWVFGMRARLAL